MVLLQFSVGCGRSVISRMNLLPPGRELRLFYFSLPAPFFVAVGSLFISFLLGRKEGRKGIRMLISRVEN